VTALREAVLRLRGDGAGAAVPVYVCWVAPRDARPNADLLQQSGVVCFDWPARTARAVGCARRYAVARERVTPVPAMPAARAGPVRTDPIGAAELLGEFGIHTVPSVLCHTADDAVRAATTAGGPVVVKLAAAAHRTELGGVRLGLTGPDEVRAAAAELIEEAGGGGVLVQPQLTGVELAVGALRDPTFGPVVMVGLGGIWVEVLADTAFALAPLRRADARELLAGLQGYPLLTGARGGPKVDLDALADVVVSAGNLLLATEIAELDLNPVLATEDDAIAVDWKISS
jgi:acetyltransferase